MKNWVLMWEGPDGIRQWEVVKDNQLEGFLKKLIEEDGVSPATVMVSFSPILFHWVWPKFHNGLSDVYFQTINDTIYGTEPIGEPKHETVNVPETSPVVKTKFGWLSPDGRMFHCDYGGHSALAAKIVGEIQLVDDPEKHLEDLGWAKIFMGIDPTRRYAVGMGLNQKLTDRQVKMLESMGLSSADGIELFL